MEGKRDIDLSLNNMPEFAYSTGKMYEINKPGKWRYVKPVINYNKCVLCMVCWKYCPDAAIKIENDKPVIDYDYCKGCGICFSECNIKAISMEEDKGDR